MSQYSQINYKLLVQQQQKQLIVLQTQLQALLVAQGKEAVPKPNIELNMEVTKLQLFDRDSGKVTGFVMICRSYIRMRM